MDKVDEAALYIGKGEKLFPLIVSKLNRLDTRPANEFRRQSDYLEICLALGLFAELLDLESLGEH